MMNTVWRVLSVWAVLFAVTAASSGLSWNTALSCLLSIVVLVLVVQTTKATGWPLIQMLFVMYFGVSWLSTHIEALLFQVLPPATALRSLAFGLAVAFATAAMLAAVLHRMKSASNLLHPDPVALITAAWAWKMPVGACAYFVLYCTAGAAIYPYIKDFYAGRQLPSLGELFVIQFFRGLLYIAIVLPFLRRIAVRPWHAALVLGLCFSVLGGLAPLLLSNQYMPVPIRFAHAVEVGISNFVFGVVVALLFVPRRVTQSVSVNAIA